MSRDDYRLRGDEANVLERPAETKTEASEPQAETGGGVGTPTDDVSQRRPDEPVTTIEVVFTSSTYQLGDFTRTIRDFEAFIVFGLTDHELLFEDLADPSADLDDVRAGLTEERQRVSAKVSVDSVTLVSPLTIVITIAAVSALFTGMALAWIGVRNAYVASQLYRERANEERAKIQLRQQVHIFLEDQLGQMNMKKVGKLSKNHPMKIMLNQVVETLVNVESIEEIPVQDVRPKK